jgi:hypothetical protein
VSGQDLEDTKQEEKKMEKMSKERWSRKRRRGWTRN